MYLNPKLILYKSIPTVLKYLCCLFLFTKCYSQNVQINGRAHSTYAGKIIELYTSTDYITSTRQKESQDTISKDGSFELHAQIDMVQPVSLKIGNVVARLYIQPDYRYSITVPELDQDKNVNSDVELFVNIGVIGRDSTELNALIFDYEEHYNQLFSATDSRYMSRALLFRRVDSLQKLCDRRYAKIKDSYFKNYVTYSIASVNASLSRGEEYLMRTYLVGKPIQYLHYEYMQFFNSVTRGYLERISSGRKGQTVYNIINTKASYEALRDFVNLDKEFASDSLRELIIIRDLWDDYFKADYSPDAVSAIVSQINLQTTIKEHKKITTTMLSYFHKMQVGSKAPIFTAISRDGKLISSSVFKGKWVYLNFFSTKNTESLKEMPKIASLKKKFGDKLVFLSICLDDSISSYQHYLKTNSKFDWSIWYNYNENFFMTGKDFYFVTGTEGYFLINNLGYLAQSPAAAPSKGIEYKLNVIFKVKPRTTRTGIR
ncbi:MAG: redoxin domain-containing protein [bacterium]|nr:redoxin domain-containing protein [bacterium]